MIVLYVILTQFLTGFGLTTRLRPVSTGGGLLGLSMLVGMGVSSVLPFVLEFTGIPIAQTPILAGLSLLAVLSAGLLRGQRTYLRTVFRESFRSVRLLEIPFLGFWAYLLVISAWKCAWFPVQPFDTVVGPDLVATFAVREHRLASSVFMAHLSSVSVFSNQPFYAPFTAMQQVIYLLASNETGPFAFGKIWLTALVLAFGLFFYADFREQVHPLLAGLLVTVVATSPELFAYTFLLQTDWANAAFFVAGVMLLQRYRETGQRGSFVLSALLFGFACWTRTETIFFLPIGAGLLLFQQTQPVRIRAIRAGTLLLAGLIPVLFWNYGFLRGYVPLPAGAHLGTLHVPDNYFATLLHTAEAMNRQVLLNTVYWGYAVYCFLGLFVLNRVFFRDWRGASELVWLIGIYLLFNLLLVHVDGANVAYTFRRGFFKILLLMYACLPATPLLQWASLKLYTWEKRSPTTTELTGTSVQ